MYEKPELVAVGAAADIVLATDIQQVEPDENTFPELNNHGIDPLFTRWR